MKKLRTEKVEDRAGFFLILPVSGRSSQIPESADTYGWLVRDWNLDVLHYWAVDVSARGINAEVQAAWVLDGRAVQDLWIMPPRSERSGQLDEKMNMFGTTLREFWARRIL